MLDAFVHDPLINWRLLGTAPDPRAPAANHAGKQVLCVSIYVLYIYVFFYIYMFYIYMFSYMAPDPRAPATNHAGKQVLYVSIYVSGVGREDDGGERG